MSNKNVINIDIEALQQEAISEMLEGVHTCLIVDAQYKLSKNGDPMVHVKFACEGVENPIQHWAMLGGGGANMAAGGIKLASACGISKVEFEEGQPAKQFMQKQVKVLFEVQEQKNKDNPEFSSSRSVIAGIAPA